MNHSELAAALVATAASSRAAQAEQVVPTAPGMYAIFTDSPALLPEPFASRLRSRDTTLVYIGIASGSLRTRLVEQDLRHRSPSTFFRGIGAVLGFRPAAGSLVGKKNQRNYRFSVTDTAAVIEWINQNLSVRWLTVDPTSLASAEKHAIRTHRPLLNTVDNPDPMPELAALRALCRSIATR